MKLSHLASPPIDDQPEIIARQELEATGHSEWLIDESLEESFPASDPASSKFD